MNPRIVQAAVVAFIAITLFGWIQVLGSGYAWFALIVTVLTLLTAAAVWRAVQHGTGLGAWWRERLHGADEGTHHAFAGVRLQVEDDGELIWLKASGVQRVLGLKEEEIVTASRVPGQWRRDEDRALWLRVDGLIQTLNTMPGRTDPRVQRFRRYLERDLLFPANERRRRG